MDGRMDGLLPSVPQYNKHRILGKQMAVHSGSDENT